jgi:hypothetical protein
MQQDAEIQYYGNACFWEWNGYNLQSFQTYEHIRNISENTDKEYCLLGCNAV